MSDYYATCRSNYFKVTNRNKFEELCERYDLILIDNRDGLVGFISNNEYGRIYGYDDETDQEFDFDDFLDELHQLLADGHVAIIMEAGSEKARYVCGYTIAINNKNQSELIELDQIYEQAKSLGSNITECCY